MSFTTPNTNDTQIAYEQYRQMYQYYNVNGQVQWLPMQPPPSTTATTTSLPDSSNSQVQWLQMQPQPLSNSSAGQAQWLPVQPQPTTTTPLPNSSNTIVNNNNIINGSINVAFGRSPNVVAPHHATTAHVDDAASTPSNTQESQLINELMAIGFCDPTEILDAIRHLRGKNVSKSSNNNNNNESNNYPTVQQVMYHIIEMRESREEARMMDQARAASERCNDQEKELRKKKAEEEFISTLMEASLDTLLKEHFKNSWLLKQQAAVDKLEEFAIPCVEAKRVLIDVLRLEKKTRAWYRKVPETYFSIALAELVSETTSSADLNSVLQTEFNGLNRSISLLSRKLLLFLYCVLVDAINMYVHFSQCKYL